MDLLDPEFLNQLSDSGPVGVIVLLGVAVVLFLRGNLRTGRDLAAAKNEAEDWKRIAHQAAENVATLVPIVESLAETTEAMWEADQTERREAEMLRRLEAERRQAQP